MNPPVARRFWSGSGETMARFIEAGDLTLDLFYRDGRVEDRWLDLHPREFDLLWRLAQSPGQRLSPRQLQEEAWRIHKEPATICLAAHIARVRGKLDDSGLGRMLMTHPEGGYYLDPPPGPSVFHLRRDNCIESVG